MKKPGNSCHHQGDVSLVPRHRLHLHFVSVDKHDVDVVREDVLLNEFFYLHFVSVGTYEAVCVRRQSPYSNTPAQEPSPLSHCNAAPTNISHKIVTWLAGTLTTINNEFYY
ncbi:hypothetical protein RT717_07935 [Imperialibacter roseus]|uniref:Uncharacterized protein n=1 Tax=Imperialibacter roseus TaxID=1324217 RepID=A0ABZ0IU53_9BACT|nr:hypothetical protein [Imperialibacter roseus]WOK08563.1 hypothetical protein RT717_07935 [Imperialibacter roseus]